MQPRTRTLFVIAVTLAVAAASATVYEYLMDIGRADVAAAEPAAPAAPDERPVVRIGVVSRFAPNLIFSGYQPIMDYLSATGSRRYELLPSTDYREAVAQLQRGDVSASFLGAWITRSLGPASGLEPRLAPRNAQGLATVRDVLIVPDSSAIDGVGDLSGRRVAVPSRDSWAGNWLQDDALPAAGLSAGDLDTLQHFDHHQTVVWRVLHGGFHAGVVKAPVAERYRAEGLRIAATSGPIPGPPLVVRASDDDPVLDEIVRLLLALDPAAPADAERLATWTPEFSWGFAPVSWSDYAEPGAPGRRP